MTLELVDDQERCYGRVAVGRELDPLADPVLGAARAAAPQVLLTEHNSVTDLVPAADSVLSRTVPLAEHVRRLQAGGHVVLAVSASDDEALDAADIGACVISGSNGVCWSAGLVCRQGLGDVLRILRAVPMARQVSQRSARLSAGGSAVGALIVTAGPRMIAAPGSSSSAPRSSSVRQSSVPQAACCSGLARRPPRHGSPRTHHQPSRRRPGGEL
jgi:cation-transporting P-type ATPase I